MVGFTSGAVIRDTCALSDYPRDTTATAPIAEGDDGHNARTYPAAAYNALGQAPRLLAATRRPARSWCLVRNRRAPMRLPAVGFRTPRQIFRQRLSERE